jgi:putative endonuclease
MIAMKSLVAPACKTAPYSVYLLRCADNTLYCGITNNIERRIEQHNAGVASKYTRMSKRRPVGLECICGPMSKGEALSLEYQVKQKSRGDKKAFLENVQDRNKLEEGYTVGATKKEDGLQKTKYYPVNIETREIIDIPFRKESELFSKFVGTNFIGIKGARINGHKCYADFMIKHPKGGDIEMVKLETAIRRAKTRLEKQEVYENFGQDEVRKIKDAYDYNSLVYGSPEERKQADKIDAFDDWCMNYTGPKNDPEPESFGPGM